MIKETHEQIIRETEKEITKTLSLLAKSLVVKNKVPLEHKLKAIEGIGNSVKCLADFTIVGYKKKKLYEPMHIA